LSVLNYDEATQVDFVLKDPDFTTALRVEEALNAALGEGVAHASTSATVVLSVPEDFVGKFARFAAAIEIVDVEIDAPARVVINERTGTVVMGADVRISAVAIAHGGLTIEVRRAPVISQPGAFSRGETVSTAMMQIEVNEKDGKLRLVEGVDIGTLVSALNTMGVKPRDLMVILQAIKSSGSLHAELVTI
jgi:flagellar P-ring protein precursor FlgI